MIFLLYDKLCNDKENKLWFLNIFFWEKNKRIIVTQKKMLPRRKSKKAEFILKKWNPVDLNRICFLELNLILQFTTWYKLIRNVNVTCHGRLKASVVVTCHFIALEVQTTVTVGIVSVRSAYQRAVQHVRIWCMLSLVSPAARSRQSRARTRNYWADLSYREYVTHWLYIFILLSMHLNMWNCFKTVTWYM